MPRREFLARLARLAGSAAAASLLLPLLENRYAVAATVAVDDPALDTGRERFDAPGGAVDCLRGAAEGGAPAKRPAVVVIHENRGLNAHIEDVARRVALAGFPGDRAGRALARSGGTPANEDEARKLIGELDRERALGIYLAAVRVRGSATREAPARWAASDSAGAAACRDGSPRTPKALDAAVVFYGMPPEPAEAARVRVPLLLHYAGLDTRINAAVPAFEAGAQGGGRALPALHVRRRRPRLPQRHERGALQRRGGKARLAAHRRFPDERTCLRFPPPPDQSRAEACGPRYDRLMMLETRRRTFEAINRLSTKSCRA